MIRRNFIKASTLASLAVATKSWFRAEKTHIISFSFDDGFKKSFYKAAEIHEEYGLSACFNVIASGHMPNFKKVDDWILPELLGDFNDWNKLKARGHEVMPHTWEHLNLTKVSLKKAKKNIDKCLDYFEKNLDGYTNDDAVFNYAFCASNDKLDRFLLERVQAVRTGGWLVLEDTMLNPIPKTFKKATLGCWIQGPDYCDGYVEKEVNNFLDGPGGWLIFNLHGFDTEGWGPIRSSYYDKLLKRLIDIKKLEVLPVGQVINRLK